MNPQPDLFGPVRSGPFHNTTHERGPELEKAVVTALKQEEKVSAIFRLAGRALTPSEVHAWGVKKNHETWLLTSVRRAISNLTDAGVLWRTHEKKRGPYKRNEYLWRLCHRTPTHGASP
jgi:hypothetical protein